MMAKNGNFFTAHYEWLALGVAVVALVGAVVYFVGAVGVDPDEAATEAVQSLRTVGRDGAGVKPVDLSGYERAAGSVKSPVFVRAIKGAEASFLASEKRVACKHCLEPIPFDADVCIFCGKKQPEEKVVVLDTDGDGLPDEWERRYGLNPDDAGDAILDKDNDGFTNLEEFQAGTDPTDPASHPDYLDSLKIVLPLKETILPFYFRNAMQTPRGMRLEFFDPKRRNDYGKKGYRYSVLEGEEIGDTGFVAKRYEHKEAKQKIQGGQDAKSGKVMEKTVDVSVVTLVRKMDNKVIRLQIEERNKPMDVQAKLVFTRNTRVEEFTVVPGSTISLYGVKYTVKAIRGKGKGAVVTLEQVGSGKPRALEALEP